ncbi:OmpA family protein [Fulvivirga sp. 29W222]|uniref:OmpA family protein n=1 Tax=Fulvivirga marina TaxID=2494733 RepID=A0A937KCF8_9BACT|nr:OmpA family protein [Fulvivirga marina]MBL6447334.1 OmpA family protein [Fulvivirga marina]
MSPLTKRAFAFCISLFLAIQFTSFSQKQKPVEMEAGYYLVVGAYSPNKEYYAKRYVAEIKKSGKVADYGFNSKKNLYFVYLDFSKNYKAAINEMRSTRESEQFRDAWVFVCSGGTGMDVGENQLTDVNKDSNQPDTDAGKVQHTDEKKGKEAKRGNNTAEEDEVEETSDETMEGDSSGKEKTGTLKDYKIMFQLENARNSKSVKGEVQIIDSERAKLLTVAKSEKEVDLPDPNNSTGNLVLICDVFGYRKSQRNINYYHPFKDTTSAEIDVKEDVYVVNFDLVRYHVGDIVVMYNVYYFNDAAIMRPESRYEVNNLLEMMQENPNYRIRIHGHTNGKSPGKIIKMGRAGSYFNLSDSNKQGFGSAKQLSKERAEIIKSYLVEKGISADRMEIKAWGGRRMLYDKFSVKAKHNVRVEIEILAE